MKVWEVGEGQPIGMIGLRCGSGTRGRGGRDLVGQRLWLLVLGGGLWHERVAAADQALDAVVDVCRGWLAIVVVTTAGTSAIVIERVCCVL